MLGIHQIHTKMCSPPVSKLNSLYNTCFENGITNQNLIQNEANYNNRLGYCPSQTFQYHVSIKKDDTDKKRLKIPKEQSESVNRRRTDNTTAKRKSTKGQTTNNDLQKIHIKQKIE